MVKKIFLLATASGSVIGPRQPERGFSQQVKRLGITKNLQLHLEPKIKKKMAINSIRSEKDFVVELKCQTSIILPTFTLIYTYVYMCVCVLLSSHIFSVLILQSFYSLSTHYW